MSFPSTSPNPAADDGAMSVSGVELERRAYRRKRQLQSVAVSMVSTVVLALVVVVGLQMSPAGRMSRRRSSPPNTLPSVSRKCWTACG